MTKSFALFVFSTALAISASAQQVDPPPQAQTPADNGSIPATLIQPIERAANYLNFFAFVNDTYDSTAPLVGSANVSGNAIQAGGGISASHDFATGSFQMSYRGDYRSYADPAYPGGTDQNLSVAFRKLLTRRFTLSLQEVAGIFPLGTAAEEPSFASESNVVQTTPFAVEAKISGSSIALSYMQNARLSYEFTGTYYLMRYNSAIQFGSNSFGGSGSAIYRLTRRTSLSGTYLYNYFTYQSNAGEAKTNTAYATISHNLPRHWTVGVSGGVTFSTTDGTVTLPENLVYGDLLIPVFVQGRYSQKATLPYFQGTVAHNWRHTVLSVSGGESVTPGNGFFLASRNLGVNGLFSYTMQRSNVSIAGYVSRLSSIANTVSSSITATDLQASYAYNLIRHVGANIRYDHIKYSTIGGLNGESDNRVSLGLYFSSKDIPLALF